jgi:hypothetical protein
MNRFLIALLVVLVLPGLALVVAVVVRLLFKGPRGSSRSTPSAREAEADAEAEAEAREE